MNRSKLKTYAPKARREFIQAVTDRAAFYGLTKKKIEPVKVQGDVAVIRGTAFPKLVAEQRSKLEERISREGFEQAMEAIAYTWFNRFVAIRYMELHGYLDHGYRVLSHPEGKNTPEIVEHAEHVTLTGLDRQKVVDLKLDGTKDEELYRLLLVAQCNALNSAMPFLFERVHGESELLLPDNLLHSDSLIRKLVTEIDEADWQEVEIIGWLYQFYISEKKDQVIGKVVKSEDIPAATQLFTPNWIVKYLVQNSIGRQWLATYPDSPLKAKMEYYIEPAEQTPEVQAQLDAITPKSLNPEEMTLLDPACGSGHILVEAYDLFKVIYHERGYRAKDIPRLILRNNLFGLEIDERAAQLASFALIMKARADDRRVLEGGVWLNVRCIQSSDGLDADAVFEALTGEEPEPLPPGVEFDFMEDAKVPLLALAHRSRSTSTVDVGFSVDDIRVLLSLFKGNDAKTFGSLIQVPERLADTLPQVNERAHRLSHTSDLHRSGLAERLAPLAGVALLLSQRYDAVATNPPYMGRRNGMNAPLREFVIALYPDARADLYSAFITRSLSLATLQGRVAMITMQSWMFLSSFQQLREHVLHKHTIEVMAHLGPGAFSSISGEVVQTTAFVLLKVACNELRPVFFRLVDGDELDKQQALQAGEHRFARCQQRDFDAIPGMPMAYWASDAVFDVFREAVPLKDIAKPRQGLATGDNDRFLRYWHEVSHERITFHATSKTDAWSRKDVKWFPLTKGGEYRKWYGNHEIVIAFDKPSYDVLKTQGNHCPSEAYYFKKGITWSTIASRLSMRLAPEGSVFETKGAMCFADGDEVLFYLLGFANSCLVESFMRFISPTLDFHEGPFGTLPVRVKHQAEVVSNVRECVDIARNDWNATERSWEFAQSPLLKYGDERALVRDSWKQWQAACQASSRRMRGLEERINALFLETYGLTEELPVEVDDADVTLLEADPREDMERLVSYGIGCIVGRYNLDAPGLAYANSGGERFELSRYKTLPPDEDGVIPITDFEWFDDDATNRFVEFVGVAWPKEHLEENLKFVAESLGAKRGVQPRDTIRRYLANDFYKDHLQTYKRRPIYWLFSSGKEKAFQALEPIPERIESVVR